MQAAGPETRHALLLMDIDGFKQVNDVFGHAAGDSALIDAAKALRSVLRRGDLVGRLGGDEFLVFLSDIPSDVAAADKARLICARTSRSFSLEVQISGSVGIACAPRDGADFETLYKKADAALYYVKGSGKNGFAFYRDNMADEHLAPEADAETPSGQKTPEKKRRMLIVDDSAIDHKMLANIFQDEFIIEKAKDGNSALIRLRHYGSAISVVLLDLVMPGIDGFAVLEKMQQSAELQSIPVIVVSGDESREACLRTIRSGATDYVTKPVDPALLRIRVHSAVSKAENERLRVKNSVLELQRAETIRYRTVLERLGAAVIEYDPAGDAFVYDAAVSLHIAGMFDRRKLWDVLLEDSVADAGTVELLRECVLSLARDGARREASMGAWLLTPAGKRRLFHLYGFKATGEQSLTDTIILTFFDVESGPPMWEGEPSVSEGEPSVSEGLRSPEGRSI